MTQDRRITDRHPDSPLDWGDTEPLAGQDWKAPVANKAAADLTNVHPLAAQLRDIASNYGTGEYISVRPQMLNAAAEVIESLARAAPAAQPDELPKGWRERLEEMREASYTISQYPETAQVVFDSVIDALDELAAPTASQPARNDVIEQCAQQVERMASNISPVELCGEAVHEAASNVITNAAAAIRVLKDLATTTSQPDEARDAEIEAHMRRCDEMRDALFQCKQELAAALGPTAASPSHPDPEIKITVRTNHGTVPYEKWAHPVQQQEGDQWIFDLAAEHEAKGNGLYGPVTFNAEGLVNFTRAALAQKG